MTPGLLILCTMATEPTFAGYPAEGKFSGRPAAAIITSGDVRYFRGQIRQGLAANPVPNFAGHYRAIIWGCGSQCVMMAIVDLRTGVVHAPPLAPAGSLAVQLDVTSPMKVEFRPESRLMILRNGCIDFARRETCAPYRFVWNGARFQRLP